VTTLDELGINLGAFATDDAEAAQRYESWKSRDPFPEIEPALLNTRDLLDYIAATAMIHPFEIDRNDVTKSLKPATCAIPIEGEYVWWQENPDRPGTEPTMVRASLRDDEDLILDRNSIVYVTLKPTFRIPDYIAARFNLKIRDVYRGFLVGTGPLVDPGFVGKLSVPLHNLTSNDYPIKGGDPLVWMEFTKLSRLEEWVRDNGEDRPSRDVGRYVAFPERKKEDPDHPGKPLTVLDYIQRAWAGPIQSSIPVLVGRAERSARAAAERISRISWIGLVGLAVALLSIGIAAGAIVYSSWSLTNDAQDRVNETRDQLREVQTQLDVQRRLNQEQQLRINELERMLRAQRRRP
jgi:deoxycytidine triphosphate deaminase